MLEMVAAFEKASGAKVPYKVRSRAGGGEGPPGERRAEERGGGRVQQEEWEGA